MRSLVTGGAGFIGSHLVDALVARGDEVVVIDDLSSGDASWVSVELVKQDVRDAKDAFADADAVWHLAANPEVRTGSTDPRSHVEKNVHTTEAVLEAMRAHDVPRIHFTSTSTVYGSADVRPTPEDYGPLLPISVYGGAKLACEGLIASYAATFAFDAYLHRFANVVGPRSNHGVTYDFVHKLLADPKRLPILGDGTQTKSYVSVRDTVAAMLHVDAHAPTGVHAYNIGSDDAIDVMTLAGIVAKVLGVTPVIEPEGGTSDGAGWVGDVKHMMLATQRLKGMGWRPQDSSADAIRSAAAWLDASLKGQQAT